VKDYTLYKHVKEAILKYRDDHPERLTNGINLAPMYWDEYYFEVVANINAKGYAEAVVDDCGGAGVCGEIAVKAWGTVRGQGIHEQYHILTSWGDLRYQPDCYRATCTPSGF
jgi:hypothetical protein